MTLSKKQLEITGEFVQANLAHWISSIMPLPAEKHSHLRKQISHIDKKFESAHHEMNLWFEQVTGGSNRETRNSMP